MTLLLWVIAGVALYVAGFITAHLIAIRALDLDGQGGWSWPLRERRMAARLAADEARRAKRLKAIADTIYRDRPWGQ